MIGGVCLGLATFLHVDVTLVRVMFSVFALATGGWGILVYLGLMFILPRATNIEEATARNTGPQTWAWDDGWPWERQGWPWERQGWPWERQGWPWDHSGGPLNRAARRELRLERRMARMSSGPASPGHALLIAFFVTLAFGWLAFGTRTRFFWGGPIFWGGPFFWGAPHWVGIVLFFVFIRVLLWPLRAARWGWSGYPGYGLYHPYSPWVAMWHGIVWIGTILFFIWLAYHFVPGVGEFMREFQANWADTRFDV